MAFKITKFTAFIATDENGEEGLIGFRTDAGMMPMIAADPVRAAQILPMAKRIAQMQGREVKVAQFTTREDIGTIGIDGEYNGLPIV